MKVTVCLPTYRRAGASPWSVGSVSSSASRASRSRRRRGWWCSTTTATAPPVERGGGRGARGGRAGLGAARRPPRPADGPGPQLVMRASAARARGGVAFLHGRRRPRGKWRFCVRRAFCGVRRRRAGVAPVRRQPASRALDGARAWLDGEGELPAAEGIAPARRWRSATCTGRVRLHRQRDLPPHAAALGDARRRRRAGCGGCRWAARSSSRCCRTAHGGGEPGGAAARGDVALRGAQQHRRDRGGASGTQLAARVLYAITVALLEGGDSGGPGGGGGDVRQNCAELACALVPRRCMRGLRAQMEASGWHVVAVRPGDVAPRGAGAALAAKAPRRAEPRAGCAAGTFYARAELLAMFGA